MAAPCCSTMAKNVKKAAGRGKVTRWQGEQLDPSMDSLWTAMREETTLLVPGMRLEFGAQAESSQVGLPFPSLCLRYFFGSTCLMLSKIMQIVGEEGCCKSALVAEVMRWFALYGGGSYIASNEGKDSVTLRCAVLAWVERWLNRVMKAETFSAEDWQDYLTASIETAKRFMDDVKGPGRTFPILFAVDSVIGTGTAAQIDKIVELGHAQRGYAELANIIKLYMQAIPALIKDYPFFIVGVNHLKPGVDFMGRPTKRIGGGKALKFYESYEVEMHRAPSPDIVHPDYGGLRLKMVCRKNSYGVSRRQIFVEFVWWHQLLENGSPQLQAAWDWDTSTIELLLSLSRTIKGVSSAIPQIKDIVDLTVANKAKRRIWSNTLGIPESDPVPYREAGYRLEQRPDLLEQLYDVLGIYRGHEFTPGVDYRAARTDSGKPGFEVQRLLYSATGSAPEILQSDIDSSGYEGGPVAPSVDDAYEDDVDG